MDVRLVPFCEGRLNVTKKEGVMIKMEENRWKGLVEGGG